MKVKLRGVKHVYIIGEYIRLDSLLKYASLVSTGGEAKILIVSGEVYVGGKLCTSRGKKIVPGDIVQYDDNVLLVRQKKYDS